VRSVDLLLKLEDIVGAGINFTLEFGSGLGVLAFSGEGFTVLGFDVGFFGE